MGDTPEPVDWGSIMASMVPMQEAIVTARFQLELELKDGETGRESVARTCDDTFAVSSEVEYVAFSSYRYPRHFVSARERDDILDEREPVKLSPEDRSRAVCQHEHAQWRPRIGPLRLQAGLELWCPSCLSQTVFDNWCVVEHVGEGAVARGLGRVSWARLERGQ